MAKKLTANFSNRVPIRRHSFSHPIHRSMIFRRRYASWSNFSGRPLWRAAWSDRWGITALIPCRRSHRRILLTLYALSPASLSGRVRGRPRGCGILTAFITSSNSVDSWRCPGVSAGASGMPLPSVTRCSFVLKPPLERPKAWFEGSFGPLFDRLQQRPEQLESSNHRCTKDPNLSVPRGPEIHAETPRFDPRCRPDATC